jgi:hypothetical protein
LPDSVNKHKRKLGPSKSRVSDDGPIVVPMTGYGQPQKKQETVLDEEEKAFVRAGRGRSITDVQEWLPE